jgi:hypothetical protein
MAMQDNKVGIFWDFEVSSQICLISMNLTISIQNCHPQTNSSGFDIVASIREYLQKIGVIDFIKAYSQVQDSPLNLRSELQCSGVTLVDCPHNGRKDVVDKMLIGMLSLYSRYQSNQLSRLSYIRTEQSYRCDRLNCGRSRLFVHDS